MSWTVNSVVPSTGWTVPLESIDSVEGIGNEGGGVGKDNNEVRENVDLGNDSEDKMIERVSVMSTMMSTTDTFIPTYP